MAEISKITLPNGQSYDLKVYVDHISGTLPITKGGTGATTAPTARTNLGLGTAATYNTSTSVGNDTNLPTGAAIRTYVTNHIIVSATQPSNQSAGDIWIVIADNPTAPENGDIASYGS